MRHTFAIIVLGLGGGLLAHLGWYAWHHPEVHAAPAATAGALDWMKSEFQLTDAQFARVQAIHASSSPELGALAGQVHRLRAELAEFERERRTEGQIDFLAFAHWVESRRTVDRACLRSTRRLIFATAEVMTPEQRARYLGLLSPLLDEPAALP